MGMLGRASGAVAVTGSLLTLTMLPTNAAPTASPRIPTQGGGVCAWSVTDAPALPGSSILYGVHALTSHDVWSVGKDGGVFDPTSLAEHWDGTAWTVVKTPNPTRASNDGNVLDAVDGTAADDVWAVGSHIVRDGVATKPFIVHFDGHRWRQTPTPPGRFIDSDLTGVAAITPDDVWAVGFRAVGSPPVDAPLAMHWDGTAWSVVHVPNPPGDRQDSLLGISAVAANDVWAVGQAGERTTLTLHFDGATWRRVSSPNPPGDARNGLTSVVTRGADDVWAVGTGGAPSGAFATHWNGSSWGLSPMQPKGEFQEMAGITAQPDGTVWAVGLFRPATPKYQTFVEKFANGRWTIVSSPSIDNGDQLEGVTSTASDIWAVGVTAAGPDFQPGAALILHAC